MERFVVALIGMVALGMPAHAAQDGRGPGGPRGPQGSTGAETILGAAFDVLAQQTIRSYFRTNPVPVQSLPPGIARNVARGRPLPPGIAKRYLPSELQASLPAHPGYEMVILDRDVLLVAVATGIVVDILLDVL